MIVVTVTTIPEVVGGSLEACWLDLKCPTCGKTNRIGTSTPPDTCKPCSSCGAPIDFWAAWGLEDLRERDAQTLRDFWADAF